MALTAVPGRTPVLPPPVAMVGRGNSYPAVRVLCNPSVPVVVQPQTCKQTTPPARGSDTRKGFRFVSKTLMYFVSLATKQQVTRGRVPHAMSVGNVPPAAHALAAPLAALLAALPAAHRVGSSPDHSAACPEGLKERTQLYLGWEGRLIA